MQFQVLGRDPDKRVPELLEDVGLDDTGGKKAGRFSLGMKQRLGIAMALCGDPDFLLPDEPANGLDPEGIVDIRELMIHLNRDLGVTILVSSHILRELQEVAARFGFIDEGRILLEISAEELERRSRHCLLVHVSDAQKMAAALDGAHIDYKVLADHQAEIYRDLEVTSLVEVLSAAGCRAISLHAQDQSLEGFFLNLVGGTHA